MVSTLLMTSNSAPREAVVLLAKGGYGDWPRREVENMAQATRESGRYTLVTSAFVDQGAPSLPQGLRECLDSGATRIVVVPAFVPLDRVMREWLPKVIRRWTKKEHIGPEIEIALAPALGDHPATSAAVTAIVASAAETPDVRVDAPERDRANQWNEIPEHTYHALLCAGPRCTTLGANDVWAYFTRRLRERGLMESEGGVIPVRTACLIPCNLGPMMVIHPGGHWYGAVNERAVDQIVEQHIVGGTPVEAHLRPRPRPDRPERPEPAGAVAAT